MTIGFQELWALALWESHNGRAGALDEIRSAALERGGTGPDPGSTQSSLRTLADVLDARLLLARGDSMAAIEALRALRPRAPAATIRRDAWAPLAAEELLLARLLMARVRDTDDAEAALDLYHEALAVTRNLANGEPSTFLAYLRPSLDIILAAAKAELRNEG